MKILPVATYGMAWYGNEHKTKLHERQRFIERSISGCKRSDRVRNVELSKTNGLKVIVQTIKHLKWDWAGHVARLDYVRNTGRLPKKWNDWLKKIAGPTWMRAAKDRE